VDPEKLKRDREELEKRQREGESFFVVWIRSNRVIFLSTYYSFVC
jgi:hypothetical protein